MFSSRLHNFLYGLSPSVDYFEFNGIPRNPVNPCHACGNGGAEKMCARCKRLRYCHMVCAEQDYKTHKIECRLWRLSSENINADVIDQNPIIRTLIDHLRDWKCLLLLGATCKSWRSYIRSMYILDEDHKLYYADDNLIGVIYSLKRKNPGYIGDYYSNPIYKSMAKSNKPCYSVLKYINYTNDKIDKLKLWILALSLCDHGSDELYNCLNMWLKKLVSKTQNRRNLGFSLVPLQILIRDHLLRCEEKYVMKNVIAVGSIVHKIITEFNNYIDDYDRAKMTQSETKIRKKFGDDIGDLWHEIVVYNNI